MTIEECNVVALGKEEKWQYVVIKSLDYPDMVPIKFCVKGEIYFQQLSRMDVRLVDKHTVKE